MVHKHWPPHQRAQNTSQITLISDGCSATSTPHSASDLRVLPTLSINFHLPAQKELNVNHKGGNLEKYTSLMLARHGLSTFSLPLKSCTVWIYEPRETKKEEKRKEYTHANEGEQWKLQLFIELM